ncbi:MAG: hypothetical protein JSS76_14270 [Bacteroidetes bacterium]|nr:hypothetical protein [Bacteroidota bacterium]
MTWSLMKLIDISFLMAGRLFGGNTLTESHAQLRTLPRGTVGREIADTLDSRGYELLPFFADHDMKHIILGYDMTEADELRMQLYMIGNGNRSLACLLPTIGSIVFYPRLWCEISYHYHLGRVGRPISRLRLSECRQRPLSEIKALYGRPPSATII